MPSSPTFSATFYFGSVDGDEGFVRRHRWLQYFTSSQSRFHFFRQVNGNPQRAQILVGNLDLRFMRPFSDR